MSTPRPHSAKILQHSTGLGAPTAEMVRKRAQELARINGRAEYTDEDWREAKRELHGGHEFNGGTDDHDMIALVSEHDMIASDPGHHTSRVGFDDDHVVEELIAEGMDEAVHEQMLAARDLEPTEEEEEGSDV